MHAVLKLRSHLRRVSDSEIPAASVGNRAPPPEPGWRAAVLDERASRHAFRLRASEEGSGYQAPASASGASNMQEGSRGVLSSANDDDGGGILDVRAADLKTRGRERSEHQPQRRAVCRRRWRNNAFPFRQIRRRRRQPSEHRSERSEPSNTARCASSCKMKACGY
jgi:hypothetical protein